MLSLWKFWQQRIPETKKGSCINRISRSQVISEKGAIALATLPKRSPLWIERAIASAGLAELSGYTKDIAVVETAMIQIVEAVFDGTMLHPTVPLDLEAGTRVRITIESVSPETPTNPKSFLQTAQSLHLQGAPDWSANLDHYLYGDAAQEND